MVAEELSLKVTYTSWNKTTILFLRALLIQKDNTRLTLRVNTKHTAVWDFENLPRTDLKDRIKNLLWDQTERRINLQNLIIFSA